MLLNNQISVNQGQMVILTSSMLNATDAETSLGSLQFTISNIKHAQFEYADNPGVAILNFKQSDITSEIVRFIQDNSRNMPYYSVLVSDGSLTDGPYEATVTFHDIPFLLKNQLTVNQGQEVVLTADNLNATDIEIPPSDLLFTTTNVQHGHFEAVSSPGTVVNSFYQNNITLSDVKFIHDGSAQAPSYTSIVNNGLLSSLPSSASIVFNPNEPNIQSAPDNTIRNSIIGASISGGFGVFFLCLKIYLEKKAKDYINKEINSDEFREKVVIPIAREVSKQVKVKGFLGYINQNTTHAFVSAIIEIINELQKLGIDVNAQMAGDPAKTRLLNQISRQTRNCVLGEDTCGGSFKSFFCAEVTPQQIEDNAVRIAVAVKGRLGLQEDMTPPLLSPSIRAPLLDAKEDMEKGLRMQLVVAPSFEHGMANHSSASSSTTPLWSATRSSQRKSMLVPPESPINRSDGAASVSAKS